MVVAETKTLVIGGTGLVGRFLLNQLLQYGHSVDVVTRNAAKLTISSASVRAVVADIASPDWLQHSALHLAEYDVVYHLAYATTGDDAYDRAVTVDSVRAVIEGLRAIVDGRSRHFVYTGSMVVFGSMPGDHIVTEASVKNGDTPYASNKIAATQLALQAGPGLLCTVLHPTGVYAEYSSRIDSYRELLSRNYVPDHLSRHGVNNIIYADDLARALVQCLNRPRDHLAEEYIVNGESKLFTEWFAELASTVRRRSWIQLPVFTRHVCRGPLRRLLNSVGIGCPLPFAEKKESVFERKTTFCSGKARAHFGFDPQTLFQRVCQRLQEEAAR